MKHKSTLKEKVLEMPMSEENVSSFCPRINKVYNRLNELKAIKPQEDHSVLEAEFVIAYVLLSLDTYFPKGKCITGPADKKQLAKSHQNFLTNTNWKSIARMHAENKNISTNNNNSNNNSAEVQDNQQNNAEIVEDNKKIQSKLHIWDKQSHLIAGDLYTGEMDHDFQKKIQRYFGKDVEAQNKLKKEKGMEPDTTLGDVPVVHILSESMLIKVPDFVRHSLLEWARGNRPGVMMTYAPTPLLLYNMMCGQQRCVSCLIKPEELCSVIADEYPPYEKRNALSFLFHDIKHLEKFVDPSFFDEQVAFLKFMQPLCSKNPTAYHCIREDLISTYDKEFANDMDHLCADMNACSPHLLQFLKAKYRRCVREEPETTTEKLSSAQVQRLSETQFVNVFATWQQEIDRFKEIPDVDWADLQTCFAKICSDDYTFADSERIRKFFVDYAKLVV